MEINLIEVEYELVSESFATSEELRAILPGLAQFLASMDAPLSIELGWG